MTQAIPYKPPKWDQSEMAQKWDSALLSLILSDANGISAQMLQ